MARFDWWVYLILALPGLFLSGMNWAIYIHNKRGKKWVSGVPLIGGLWIAAAALLSPCNWLALAGLADPGVWLLLAALTAAFIPSRREQQKNRKAK